MLSIALFLQLQATDSIYATPALRAFVARAAIENLAPPRELMGYRASAETEFGLIMRDSLGRETVFQIEQLAAQAEWERAGRYDLHVVGYRAQSLGAPYSALTFTRMYSVPTLYGSRLALGMNDNIPRNRADSNFRRQVLRDDSIAGRTPYRAVHPLAADRDRYYRFHGGDTVAIITSNKRTIRVVRIHSELNEDPSANFVGFKGELDFDADRFQLVRMRGRFVNITTRKGPLLVRNMGTVVAYVEFENAEVGGKYWLPTVQRSEIQAEIKMLRDVRPIYRIITRFRDFKLDLGDTTVAAEDGDSAATPLPPTRAKLTFASQDSVSKYGRWEDNMGAKIGAVGSDDFQDLAPDAWKPTGRPTVSYWPKQIGEIVHYNRVEGLFTGVSGTIRFRDVAPGLTARGMIGAAWAEQTLRGLGTATLRRGNWITGLRVERALQSTNDFLGQFEGGQSIGPLLASIDDHDYVDRWTTALSTTRIIKDIDRALVSLEVAWVRDHDEVARLKNGLLSTNGASFRPNRRAISTSYQRNTATIEYHPRVNGDGLTPGLGARIEYTAALGDIPWQRIEASLSARRYWRGVIFSSHIKAGAVLGDSLLPQTLYELGGTEYLPSYEYKEFGGDRAALGRAMAAYYFPVLRTPRRIGRLVLPGISPGIGAGVHGGWAGVYSQAARASLLALGGDGTTPLSAPSGKVRATADFRVTFLSGAVALGIARPVDHPASWRPFFVWGAGY